MAACDGAGLYSLLTSLDHPLAASLDPEALDWVCETPECADFLQWILNNLSRDNVVMDGDLEAFKLIPEEEVLSGGILSEALSSFGMADGQRLTEQELAREVNRLEVELGMMEESKDKLDQVNEILEAELSREQEKLVQLDHLEERAEVEERRMQEKMILLNTNYNQTVLEVGQSVMKLSKMYEAAKEDMESPHFLSSINLNKITEADAIVDQEVEALMATYFSKSSRHDQQEEEEVSEQRRGRDQDQFEVLISEISRLRVSLVRQEMRRLRARSEEAGLLAVAQMLADTKAGALAVVVRQETEDVKNLESEALEVLEQSIELQCKKIMNIEQQNKVRRNELVIKRLESLRDLLLQQLAKREILAVLLDREMKEVKMVEEMYRDLIQIFKKEATKFSQFKAAMKDLGGRKSESEANLIPPEDFVMLKVHKVLHNHKLVSHVATYEEVFKSLNNLEEKNKRLDHQLEEKQRSVREEIASSTEKMSEILNILVMNETGSNKKACLTPKNIENGMEAVRSKMLELNDELKKVTKDWKKDVEELKIKPELSILREMWIDFLVKPKSLVAAMKNLELKAKNT